MSVKEKEKMQTNWGDEVGWHDRSGNPRSGRSGGNPSLAKTMPSFARVNGPHSTPINLLFISH